MNVSKYLNNKWIKSALFLSIGAIGGYSYYYFIGCNGGSCPITSNPYISSGYGMVVGLLLSFDSKNKKDKAQNKQEV